jgi:hypothetical protein
MPDLRHSWYLFVPVAVVFCVLFGPVLFAPPGYAPATQESDFYMYYFPMTEAAFEILSKGEFPLWNPYLFCGMPFLASIEIGVLYPPNWVHLIVPAERGFCLLYVFHILLAGIGSWVYARARGRGIPAALISTTSFALAAPTILHFDMGMTSVVYSSAWCPLIFALVERYRQNPSLVRVCGLSLVLACQFLAGFPMFTLLLAALIPAYLLVFAIDWRAFTGRRNLLMLCGLVAAAALALGLVMPQLLATSEYLEHAHRGELNYQQATHCCFPAPNLVTFFVPEFFGNDKDCLYWGETFLFDANPFCGVITILLSGLTLFRWRSREVVFWSVASAMILAFSLGKYSWFYDLCYLYLPGPDRFRGVARLSIFAVFGVSVLAGIGFEQAVAGRLSCWQRRVCLAFAALSAISFGWAVLQLGRDGPSPDWWPEFVGWVRGPGAELYSSIAPAHAPQFFEESFSLMLQSLARSSATLLAAALLLFVPRRTPRAEALCSAGLLALLAAELGTFDGKQVALSESEPRRRVAREMRSIMKDDHDLFRVTLTTKQQTPNRLLYGRLQTPGGHENFVLARYSLFIYKWTGIEPEYHTFLVLANAHHTFDLLNVKYFAVPQDVKHRETKDELVRDRAFLAGRQIFSVYRKANCLPRVSIIHRAHYAVGLDQAARMLKLLDRGRFQTDSIIEDPAAARAAPISDDRVESAKADEGERGNATDGAHVVEYGPNRIVVEARNAAPGWLIFIESFYPGWEARVDGIPAPVHAANLFMRAVPIAAGRHHVEMIYRPKPFQIGCHVAAATLVVEMMLLVLSLVRALRNRAAARV